MIGSIPGIKRLTTICLACKLVLVLLVSKVIRYCNGLTSRFRHLTNQTQFKPSATCSCGYINALSHPITCNYFEFSAVQVRSIFQYFYRREGEKRLTEHIQELKKQLAARDQMIQRLQKDLKGKEQVKYFFYAQ